MKIVSMKSGDAVTVGPHKITAFCDIYNMWTINGRRHLNFFDLDGTATITKIGKGQTCSVGFYFPSHVKIQWEHLKK